MMPPWSKELERGREDVSDDARLAVLLIRDVLGVTTEEILSVLKLSLSERGFIDLERALEVRAGGGQLALGLKQRGQAVQ